MQNTSLREPGCHGRYSNGINKNETMKEYNQLRAQLVEVAVNGLPAMYDSASKLFIERMFLGKNGHLQKEGVSYRYSIITLLGLHEYERNGGVPAIDLQLTLQHLFDNTEQIENGGDVGLLLWLFALAKPEKLDQLYSKLDIANIFQKYPDVSQDFAMSLGWLLTGASYAIIADEKKERWKNLAISAYRKLLTNYHGKGIFRHQPKSTVKGFMRGWIGSFADQVYPVYGLTTFARAFDNDDALAIAVECAKTIVRHQGEMGQWWWHYDATNGRMAGKYPVFGTHQNGMAPMMLLKVADASGENFHPAIFKGLKWLSGVNELGANMIDSDENVVWRCIHKDPNQRYWDGVWAAVRASTDIKSTELEIKYECRPYHLGWILYAFAAQNR